MVTKAKVAKVCLKVAAFLFIAFVIFALWMRGGEEAALDYTSMAYLREPVDADQNGFTYLREFAKTHEAEFPDEYGYEIDYSRRENWDQALFTSILDQNREFISGMEAAFDYPYFVHDLELSPETLIPNVGVLRSYVNLRVLEVRVLQMNDSDSMAFERLMDLKTELDRFVASRPGALIGWLTSNALVGILEIELAEFQSAADLPAQTWLEAAQHYTLYREYPNAMQQAFRQEFQFFQHCVQLINDIPSMATDFSLIEEPSWNQKLFAWVAVNFGFKTNRTTNEIFLAYRELVEQAALPINEREYRYGAQLHLKLENRSWSRFMNRNPYGEVLLTIPYPAIYRVVEISTRRDVSSRAMQLSLALQAYFVEHQHLPESLVELVPDYLPSIPADPYDGQPMRYSKERAIVYSVGDDFIDSSGSDLPFTYSMPEDAFIDECAELDSSEPTYPLRFFNKSEIR